MDSVQHAALNVKSGSGLLIVVDQHSKICHELHLENHENNGPGIIPGPLHKVLNLKPYATIQRYF